MNTKGPVHKRLRSNGAILEVVPCPKKQLVRGQHNRKPSFHLASQARRSAAVFAPVQSLVALNMYGLAVRVRASKILPCSVQHSVL